jgi:hypothetical protein
MGHTTIKMIEQHYGKLIKNERPDMAKVFQTCWAITQKYPISNEIIIIPIVIRT